MDKKKNGLEELISALTANTLNAIVLSVREKVPQMCQALLGFTQGVAEIRFSAIASKDKTFAAVWIGDKLVQAETVLRDWSTSYVGQQLSIVSVGFAD